MNANIRPTTDAERTRSTAAIIADGRYGASDRSVAVVASFAVRSTGGLAVLWERPRAQGPVYLTLVMPDGSLFSTVKYTDRAAGDHAFLSFSALIAPPPVAERCADCGVALPTTTHWDGCTLR